MGRGEIAAALFQSKEGQWRRLVDEQVTTIDAILTRIDGPTVFCGVISPEIASRLREELGPDAAVPGDGEATARARFVAQLGWRRLNQGEVDDLPTLQPMYLRKPSITVSRRRPLSPRT
jgi:tRNA threonylcarbamoyladenosine biosynthesis protein TsaB